MTVQDLQGKLSSLQFAEYMAYYKLHPFSDEERREDARNALLCAIVAQANSSKQCKVEDFMLLPKPKKTEEELGDELYLKFLAISQGATQ